MNTFLLIVNIFVTLVLIGVIIIQRSEGGGLGLGGGARAFMTGRGAANLLTHTTAVLAALFMGLCLLMAVLNSGVANGGADILSNPPARQAPAPTGK